MKKASTVYFVVLATMVFPAMLGAADWDITNPTQNEHFSTTSNVAGEGETQFASRTFTAKIIVNGVTEQSGSSTSSPNFGWTHTLNAPAGGFTEAKGTFEVWSGGNKEAFQDIEFTDGQQA